MGDQEKLRTMRRVVETRDLRKRSAEAREAREAAALADLRARGENDAERLAQTQARWEACIAQPVLDPAFAGYWTEATLREETVLRRTETEILLARRDHEAADAALRLASAHREAAGQLLGVVRRSTARRQEEALLAETSDRTAQTWRRP
ncbi:hypothetical protein [Caulobacter sp. DWR1-3-2b1]|uniref:hypothetical protein n=1 Tax=Caulobacter sp. DWR1-3-2b1 TaxID=2804670 RepID=UPI003CE81496